jgi:cytochrome d ubiquinol oxidase subunit I
VGVGLLMLVIGWLGLLMLWRRGWNITALPRWLLWPLSGMAFSGWVATLAGWYVTEIGRQPFVVYGLVRTADVASTVPPAHIALTLTLYVVTYAALLLAFIGVVRHMAEKPESALLPATQPLPSRAFA